MRPAHRIEGGINLPHRQIERIKYLRKWGYKISEIAEDQNVSEEIVNKVLIYQ